MNLDSRFAARVAYSRRFPHALFGQHAGGHSRKGRNMLKLQGIEALFGSVPLFRVFLCARCYPQMNTLKINT